MSDDDQTVAWFALIRNAWRHGREFVVLRATVLKEIR